MKKKWANDPVLAGGNACGALLRSMDWSLNPLGPPSGWPKELRTLVSVMLGSRQPVLIVWGPEQTTLYNDGYADMCGRRHPAALGRPFKDLWYEIWDAVEPILSKAYAGVGTQMDDIQFTMLRNGYPEETHFSFSYTPVRNEAGAVLGMFCVCAETTRQVLLQRRADDERVRLQLMFEQAPGAIALLEGPNHVFALVNRAYENLVGRRHVAGRTVRDILPEAQAQGYLALLDSVYATGEPYVGTAIRFELQDAPGQPPRERYLDFVYQPMRDLQGQVSGIFVQAQDVTSRVKARAHQELRNRELGHRLKNQLAMVLSIVSQTLRTSTDIESARDRVVERLVTLSKAHDLLIQDSTDVTSVARIVRSVLDLHEGEEDRRFDVDGPQMMIASRPSLSLSLILHELATNAVKYGALSANEGKVTVRWAQKQGEGVKTFLLTWKESGGPDVTPPQQTGTGSRLIRAGLDGAVVSEVNIDYLPEGLVCRITAELESVAPTQELHDS